MRCIVYTRPEDGGVSVVHPAPDGRLWERDGHLVEDGERRRRSLTDADMRAAGFVLESDDAWLARVRLTVVPLDAQDVREVDPESLPSRRWRNAWKLSGGACGVCPVKARGLHLAEVRRQRDERLRAADGPAQRAQDRGDPAEIKRWADYRQALRDLPAQVAAEVAAYDPESLAAYAPAWPLPPE
jgi:hypothetical protein